MLMLMREEKGARSPLQILLAGARSGAAPHNCRERACAERQAQEQVNVQDHREARDNIDRGALADAHNGDSGHQRGADEASPRASERLEEEREALRLRREREVERIDDTGLVLTLRWRAGHCCVSSNFRALYLVPLSSFRCFFTSTFDLFSCRASWRCRSLN